MKFPFPRLTILLFLFILLSACNPKQTASVPDSSDNAQLNQTLPEGQLAQTATASSNVLSTPSSTPKMTQTFTVIPLQPDSIDSPTSAPTGTPRVTPSDIDLPSSPTPVPTRPPTLTPTQKPRVEKPVGEIAYFDMYERIYLRDLSNTSPDQLLFDNTHTKYPDLTEGISWSPDGKKVAFVMIPGADIYLLTLGANDAVNLTRTDNYFEMAPAISPNGKLIAFVSDRRKAPGHPMDLYTMRLDGSGIRILFECQEKCDSPEWSPDGKRLVFQMGKDLYIIPASGGKPAKVVAGGTNQFPAWSPDGQWIAFIRSVSYGYPSFIYLVKPDGSDLHAITDDTLGPRQITWSPDSKFIAFENFPPEGQPGFLELKAVHVETGWLFTLAGVAYAPSWRPYDLAKIPKATATTASILPDCTNGWSRLQVGRQAKVAGKPGETPNRVRAEPGLSGAQIGLLEPGTIMTLLEGPLCVDGLVWWKISEASLPGGVGWTAEGDGKEYWLNPLE